MAASRLKIRELARRDVGELIELLRSSFPKELEVSGFDEATARKTFRLYGLRKIFQKLSRRPFVLFYVGEVGGEIVATITLNRERESWYIGTVMVAPGYRRKGYGRAILTYALEVAQAYGGKRAVLHVLEDNLPAMRLYESIGFVRFERVVHLVCEPPVGEEISLPKGYGLERINFFDPRAARLSYEAMEPESRGIYGEPKLPPRYVRPLARLQPGIKERYAVTHGKRWAGVYTFTAPFREKGAANASLAILQEHRGIGLEEALLSLALRRARELGCPRLLVQANVANRELVSACEALGFTRLYLMEGMYRDL